MKARKSLNELLNQLAEAEAEVEKEERLDREKATKEHEYSAEFPFFTNMIDNVRWDGFCLGPAMRMVIRSGMITWRQKGDGRHIQVASNEIVESYNAGNKSLA
jgi:hypothetical protein